MGAKVIKRVERTQPFDLACSCGRGRCLRVENGRVLVHLSHNGGCEADVSLEKLLDELCLHLSPADLLHVVDKFGRAFVERGGKIAV
jgi:hypothetical protein